MSTSRKNPAGEELIQAVVTGKKSFDAIEYDGHGNPVRKRAMPGDVVYVTARQMQAFSHMLKSRRVAEAEAEAQRAIFEEEEAQREAQAAATKVTTGSVRTSQGKDGDGKSAAATTKPAASTPPTSK